MKSQDTAELFFDNVKVPKENRLGDEKMGFKIMMKSWPRTIDGRYCCGRNC
jgi:alkylation response protein AidB-like acyl-CoA dehydrogenase